MSAPFEPPTPVDEAKKALMILQAQRDALELEADAITSELNAPGPNGEPPLGARGSLVDSDGFPLAGYDLLNIREKRNRLSYIQTDHKAVMGRIEKALHALHAAQAAAAGLTTPGVSVPSSGSHGGGTTAGSGRPSEREREEGDVAMVPIAKVNEVSQGSPAATAGLTVGDLIIRFGQVDISHPKGLGGAIDVVRERQGQEVSVLVLREGGMGGQSGIKELKLVPKTWGGPGLLGVHLLPP